jgi:hypothetical protein
MITKAARNKAEAMELQCGGKEMQRLGMEHSKAQDRLVTSMHGAKP